MEKVVVCYNKAVKDYPSTPTFSPNERFPEYPYVSDCFDETNKVYAMVRSALASLGLDKANYGTKEWNPLGRIITPGDFVLIKPNFVTDHNALFSLEPDCDGRKGVIVNGSILRAIVDYVFLATGEKGKIVIADNTMHSTPLNTFNRNLKNTGTEQFIRYLQDRGVPISAYDLRTEEVHKLDLIKVAPKGDPLGSTVIDLGSESELEGLDTDKIAFNQWNTYTPRKHHSAKIHEYSISNTVLSADVVISVPKLKTHAKVGATLSLKNTFGISNQKNWVPHFRKGTPSDGGDEREDKYTLGESVIQWLKTQRFLRKTVRALKAINVECSPEGQTGGWYGNDTIWRGVLDMNKILLYADKDGRMQESQQRRYLSVIDGIIGGEGDGPLTPTPKICGMIIAGEDPIATDIIATDVMGFDYKKIRLITNAMKLKTYRIGISNLEDIKVVGQYETISPSFTPPDSWVGRIEK